MSDFITLTCPNCGGRLQVTQDVERFACAFCGVEHLVRRGGGIVTLSPVVEGLGKVQAGVDRAASELAIQRLEPEIKRLEEELKAFEDDAKRRLQAQQAAQPVMPPAEVIAAQQPRQRPFWLYILAIGILLPACLFLTEMALAGMVIDSTGPESSESDAAALLFCFSMPLVMLGVGVWLFRLWRRRAQGRQGAAAAQAMLYDQKLQAHLAQRSALEKEIEAQRTARRKELDEKREQLARHRQIVDKF